MNILINLLLLIMSIVILTIALSGGFELNIFSFSLQAHRIDNPLNLLIVLIGLKLLHENYKKRTGLLTRTKQFLQTTYGIWVVFGIILLMAVWIKLWQHYTFRTGAFDLAIYDSALSNTLKGRFLYSQWIGRCYLSEHCSPILLGLLPVYAICNNPVILLLVQAIAFAGALIPLYYLALRIFKDQLVSFGIMLVYMNYRYLINGFMYDFHQEMFEPVLLFSLFYFYWRAKYLPYFVVLILALTCKEDMPIYLAGFGVYACVISKRWRFGAPTIVISALWLIIALKIVIPGSLPDGVHKTPFLERWSNYGETYSEIAWGLIADPSIELGKRVLSRLWKMLAPLGFLPVADPLLFSLAMPPLLLNCSSGFDIQQSLSVHYALPIVPFFFIALICGLHRLVSKFAAHEQLIKKVFFVFLLIFNTSFYRCFLGSTTISKHDIIGHRLIDTIPTTASVAAQANIVPHLTLYHHVSIIPDFSDAEYVLFDTDRSRWPMNESTYENILNTVLTDRRYTLMYQGYGWYLLKKTDVTLDPEESAIDASLQEK